MPGFARFRPVWCWGIFHFGNAIAVRKCLALDDLSSLAVPGSVLGSVPGLPGSEHVFLTMAEKCFGDHFC